MNSINNPSQPYLQPDTASRAQKKLAYSLLFLIVLIGAVLRIAWLSYGAGTHPDERHMVMVTEKLSFADMNPHSFAYGSLSYYAVWLVSKSLGYFWPQLTSYDGLFLVGRSVCVLFGLATILLTFFLAKRLYSNYWVGLVAAALLSFNAFHIQLSRYFTSDVILTFLTLLALWSMLEMLSSKKLRYGLLSGFVIGLALATKISAAILLVPLTTTALALGHVSGTESKEIGRRYWPTLIWTVLKVVLCATIIAAIAFVIAEPYAILDYSTFIKHTNEQTGMARGLWRLPYTIQYEHTTPFLYHLQQIASFTIGWPTTLAAIFGGIISGILVFRKKDFSNLCLLAWTGSFFLATAGMQVKFPRYLLPIYPELFIFAALFLIWTFGLVKTEFKQIQIAKLTEAKPFFLAFSWPKVSLEELFWPALIIILALVLRLAGLEGFPIRLHNDEMNVGLEARKFLSGSSPSVFGLSSWLAYPEVVFYIISKFLSLAGNNLFALRLSAVFFGIISLIAFYGMLHILFNKRIAILGLIIASFYHWHIHFSRTAFTQIYSLSFASLALLALAYAWRSKSTWVFTLSGALIAITCYLVDLAYIIPCTVLLWIVISLIAKRNEIGRLWFPLLCGLGVFFVCILPRLLQVASTEISFGPWGSLILNPANEKHLIYSTGSSAPLAVFVHQMKSTLLLFISAKDSSLQYGYRGLFLDPLMILLFLAGLLISIFSRYRKASLYFWAWLISTLVFGGCLSIDTPFAPRLLCLALIVPAFCAITLDWIANKAEKLLCGEAVITNLFIGLLICISAVWNMYGYFISYPDDAPPSRRDYIGRFLERHPDIKTVLSSLTPREEFRYESYPFIAPGMNLINLDQSALSTENLQKLVDENQLPILVLTEKERPLLSEIAPMIGTNQIGSYPNKRGQPGFLWYRIP